MKLSILISVPFVFVSSVVAQSSFNTSGCIGDIVNNFCCQNGNFSGPIFSSIVQSFASQASVLSSEFATTTSATSSVITPRALLERRVITSEIAPGLTCIGDSVSSIPYDGNIIMIESTGPASPVTSSTSARVAGSSSLSSTSKSTNFAPLITQAPVLVIGAAAAVAYGAM